MMPLFYINLSSAVGRRAEMERQLVELGLAAQRVEAVTPKDISGVEIRAYCNPERYRWVAPTELACSLSHIKAWRQILDSGAGWGAVFEDDAILSTRLPAFLDAVERQRSDAQLIKLEVCPDRVRSEMRPLVEVAKIELRRVFGFSGGTAGYIISASLILRIIERIEIRQTPLDRALFDSFGPLSRELAFLQADPGLAVQADQMAEYRERVEPSAIKPDLQLRFRARSRSRALQYLYSGRRWWDQNVTVGLQKTYLDMTGLKKRQIEFLP